MTWAKQCCPSTKLATSSSPPQVESDKRKVNPSAKNPLCFSRSPEQNMRTHFLSTIHMAPPKRVNRKREDQPPFNLPPSRLPDATQKYAPLCYAAAKRWLPTFRFRQYYCCCTCSTDLIAPLADFALCNNGSQCCKRACSDRVVFCSNGMPASETQTLRDVTVRVYPPPHMQTH